MLSVFKFVKEQQSQILIWVLSAKLCYSGLTLTDCLGALVFLATIQVSRVIDYLFPERPDLFKELSLIQEQFKKIKSQTENLESDVTGLKFGMLQSNKR